MRYILMVCCLALVACSSQPTSNNQQYLLPDSEQAIVASSKAPLLVIDVELAQYLDVDGIVYRVSDSEVIEAKQNQWAMDLRRQLQNQIVAQLKAKQTQYWPVQLNNALKTQDSDSLVVNIERFNGSYTGDAQVSGEWMLISPEGKIHQVQTFNYAVPLDNEGYAALVKAMSEGLQMVTDEISASF
ncbi:membrane integrity-associated transporter subunit PqiC [Vibrio taketomensis]|uniref:PqiC family protein n=1 Tax=Vibrio taketomensis TaxID=2572923 RepID=UPI00138A4AA2|nr:ABC-type transport auxiliary lipoprotein family protein [Vibrio taketomensis]